MVASQLVYTALRSTQSMYAEEYRSPVHCSSLRLSVRFVALAEANQPQGEAEAGTPGKGPQVEGEG